MIKVTANGIYRSPKLMIIRKNQEYLEVAVPPEIVERIVEVPINPTRELCESLYPPNCPSVEPKPDWDAGEQQIDGAPSILYDRTKYPSITKGDKGRVICYVLHEDAEVPWAQFEILTPYTENDYGFSLVPPLYEVERFYNYHSKWVPNGLPGSPRDSREIAFLAHSLLRFHIGNACSMYAYGEVSWSPEKPHGFNLVIAYPDLEKPYDWFLYLFDLSMKIPVTLVKKDDPYKLINFFAYDVG